MIASRPAAPNRDIFTIARYRDGWAVAHNGEFLDPSPNKDEVRAAAHKRARASHDAGRPSQVTVSDEPGYFAGR